MTWIETVPPEKATGRLKQEYEQTVAERGALANMHTVTSLHPGALGVHMKLYEELHFGESPLSRRERELIATVVSRENKCGYCVSHHADAFGRHASEPGLQALVATDYRKAQLSTRERAIADHAVLLTNDPAGVTPKHLDALRAAGLDDRAILDLTLEVAYFAFANRVANGLGLTGEDVSKAYRY